MIIILGYLSVYVAISLLLVTVCICAWLRVVYNKMRESMGSRDHNKALRNAVHYEIFLFFAGVLVLSQIVSLIITVCVGGFIEWLM